MLVVGGRNDTAALNTSQLYDPASQTFADPGTMTTARFGHTATLLANNTVLVTGGNSGSTTATAELWSGSFASAANLNSPREKHTATLLLDGTVLIVGGVNGSSPVVSAELYNPSTGASTYTAGNLNTARFNHTATLLANGKVLISGGNNGSVALKTAELYDPATGAFSVVGSMRCACARRTRRPPDLTRLRDVRDGDTLPLLVNDIYGKPELYLEVARANRLFNFRKLKAASRLSFPPLANEGSS